MKRKMPINVYSFCELINGYNILDVEVNGHLQSTFCQ